MAKKTDKEKLEAMRDKCHVLENQLTGLRIDFAHLHDKYENARLELANWIAFARRFTSRTVDTEPPPAKDDAQ